MKKLYWDAININGEKIFYTVTEKGLNFVSSPGQGVSQVLDFYDGYHFEYIHSHSATDHYRKSVKKFVKGKNEALDFDIDYFADSDADEQKVWQAIAEIPYAKTITLVDLMQKVNLPKAKVIKAMQKNPIWLAIPMHRVVERENITGFRTDESMREYLRDVEQKPKTEFKKLL